LWRRRRKIERKFRQRLIDKLGLVAPQPVTLASPEERPMAALLLLIRRGHVAGHGNGLRFGQMNWRVPCGDLR
jgi:hypothetical protein